MLTAAAVAGALAVLAAWPPPSRPPSPARVGDTPTRGRRRDAGRAVVSAGAGFGGWVVVGGTLGWVAGVAAVVLAWRVLAGVEPASLRRAREEARRDLPHLVDLLAATLRSGHAPMSGLAVACEALPGAAAVRLRPVLAHAALGGSLGAAWELVAEDDVLAPLGRALARSQRTGASVVDAVEMLAEELEREANSAAEDRARQVGVIAAIPLGLCLLPAFVLIGIVPTVAVMLSTVTR